MKKKSLLSAGLVFVILIIGCLGLVLAVSGVDLKITGTIGDYSSDVRLRTDSDAGSGSVFDAYDMVAPDSPSDYAKFYSSITGASVSIDSWSPAARTLSLVYDVPTGETGDVVFSWNDIGGSTYTSTFSITGDVSGLDMVSDADNVYTYTATNDSDIYVTISIGDVAEAVSVDAPGGGGGGTTPSKIPIKGKDIFIGNKFMDVFIGLEQIKIRKLNIYNEADETIEVILEVPEKLKNILEIDEKDLKFDLAPGKRKTIDVRIIAPKEVGVYWGNIYVTGIARQEILATITVSKEELLFDAEVLIPWEYRIIEMGSNLPAQTTLIPMIKNPRVDVTTNYIIKDFEGRIFYEDSKTFLINGTWIEQNNFPTGNLQQGEYFLELELTYPNGIAISRASFEVRRIERIAALLDYRVVLLLLGIGILILIILMVLIKRKYKKIRKH